MPNNSDQVFKAIEQKMALLFRRLPRQLGTEVVRYSMQRFREQGWDGRPWPSCKPGSKNNTGRALLVQSGRLRRSIRITGITDSSVTIGSDVPYAKVHNEGFKGTELIKAHTRNVQFTAQFTDLTSPSGHKIRKAKGIYQSDVKAHSRKMRMPQRQFLGNSPYLRRNLERIITAQLMKLTKS